MTVDSEYIVTLRLRVIDRDQLWDAAATRGLSNNRLNMMEVIDTIGPREDAHIDDCLAMLFDPSALPGCCTLSWNCMPSDVVSCVSTPAQAPTRQVTDLQRLFR